MRPKGCRLVPAVSAAVSVSVSVVALALVLVDLAGLAAVVAVAVDSAPRASQSLRI